MRALPVVVLQPAYHGSPAIARTLGRQGIPVYGVHGDARSPSRRSRYWARSLVWDLEGAAPEDTVAWLVQLGRGLGERPLLIPTDDPSCLFVADHASTLKEAFLFPEQPPGLARRLSNKGQMYRLCKQHGVPTAETVFPTGRADVTAFIARAQFPVVLKGIESAVLQQRTGRRMAVANSEDELLEYYDRLEDPSEPNLMLQEHIPGGSEAVWMFNGYFDSESTCLFGLTGRKLRQYPAYGGVTALGLCEENAAVAGQTVRFMKELGYRGVLDIGYKFDFRTGEYRLLDVNPRVGGTFRLFVDSMGMDVVRALYRDLTGHAVVTGSPPRGRKWLAENSDALSALAQRRQGDLTLGGWLASFRGVRETLWFAWDDPWPFTTLVRRSKWSRLAAPDPRVRRVALR